MSHFQFLFQIPSFTSCCPPLHLIFVLDTYIEQDYLIKDCLPILSDFCYNFGFSCDIIHLSSNRNKLPGKNWALEDKTVGFSPREVEEMKRFGMPVLMLVCFARYSILLGHLVHWQFDIFYRLALACQKSSQLVKYIGKTLL